VALLDVDTTTPENGGEVGRGREGSRGDSGEVRHGSELGGDGSKQHGCSSAWLLREEER
jgi:hypothetical protein